MKIMLTLLWALICSSVNAEQFSSLYGFSLGDPITEVNNRLGDPDKVIDLEDKSKVFVYFSEEHYAAFVALAPKNETIYSIQVTGDKSSVSEGLDGVRLGDPIKKALDQFGEPSSSRDATDQQTNEKVEETLTHFYGENFSLEESNGVVSSIKLTYDETLSSDNPADEKQFAQQPEEIKKLRDFILNRDYPEIFKDKSYRVAIDDIQLIDLDKDGQMEAVVLFRPYYLQSPTIVIYQFLKDGTVTRLRESLAPGPLVKRGDYFLDSHELGMGVDFSVGDEDMPSEQFREIAESATNNFNLVVQYSNFLHGDSRTGLPMYIDMSHVDLISTSKACAEFQYSKVDGINVGYKDGEKGAGMIAALVGKNIYLYQINAINQNGYLDKELTIMDTEK